MWRHRRLYRKGRTAIANNILLRHGAEAEGEASDKHASYSFHGVHIENHRIILRINNPAGNRYFQRLIQEWYPQHAETREIHEYPVSLPPVTFNALYIFMHAFVHFLNSGIGLRQVCDWTVCWQHVMKILTNFCWKSISAK